MFTRMGLGLVPWFFPPLGLLWKSTYYIDPYYFYVGLEGIYVMLSLLVSWKLYCIRHELKQKFLNEAKSLLSYSVVCLIEWIWTNSIYLIMDMCKQPQLLALYTFMVTSF